jgi:hypothetical protein
MRRSLGCDDGAAVEEEEDPADLLVQAATTHTSSNSSTSSTAGTRTVERRLRRMGLQARAVLPRLHRMDSSSSRNWHHPPEQTHPESESLDGATRTTKCRSQGCRRPSAGSCRGAI